MTTEPEIEIHPPNGDPNGHHIYNAEFWDEGYLYEAEIIASWFLCPHCRCWVDYEDGGADEYPEACTTCWDGLTVAAELKAKTEEYLADIAQVILTEKL